MNQTEPNCYGRYAWTVVVLLVPVALLNYLDRQMLAAMKIGDEGHSDNSAGEELGLLLGAFKWVYAFLSPIGGYMADRFSRRHVRSAASLFVWSAVTWATGHVTTYDGAAGDARAHGHQRGVLHSGGTGADRGLPHRPHAVAGGRHASDGAFTAASSSAASAVMWPTIPTSAGGWRSTPAASSACSMPCRSLFLLRNPRPHRSWRSRAEPSPLAARCANCSTNGSFILLVLYFTLPALAGWVVRDWMPAILKRQFDIGQGKAGVSATLYWQIAAHRRRGARRLAGGSLDAARTPRADLRQRHRHEPASCRRCSAWAMPARSRVAVAFLILFGLGWGFFDCNNMPILCQIVRPELRATGYGIMNFVSISCGGFADWGFGVLRDRHVPLNVIFGVFASAAMLSVVLVLLIRPRRAENGT